MKLYLFLFIFLAGCMHNKSQSLRDGSSQATVQTNTSQGVTSGSFSASATSTQTLAAPADSPVAGASVAIAPGTLAIDTSIAIQTATPIATATSLGQLGVAGTVTSAGTAVDIQPSVATDPLQPFTVALTIPPQAGLLDTSANLVALYKTVNAAGATTLGVIPTSQITVSGNTASFAINQFGAYQLAYLSAPVTTAASVSVPTSALTAAAAAALPQVQLLGRSPFMVASNSKVTLTGKNFRPSMILAMGGKPVGNLQVMSDVSASFTTPSGSALGLTSLSLDQDGVTQTASIVYTPSTDYPYSNAAASTICSDQKFYDASGNLQTGTRTCTQPTITSSEIVSGVTIDGTAGSVTPAPANCTADGQTNCVATATFPAAGTANISPWDLRAGKSLAGISGALKTNCRNGINSTYFNYDGSLAGLPISSVTSGTMFDFWDTTDDYYVFSPNMVTAWSSNTFCDASTWADVTTVDGVTPSTCNGTTCIYQDKISNLQVGAILGGTASPDTLEWNAAIQACYASTYGGYAAGTWRLPTQKELLAMYEHGIMAIVSANLVSYANTQNSSFWSSTSSAQGNGIDAYQFFMGAGNTGPVSKNSTLYAVCVK